MLGGCTRNARWMASSGNVPSGDDFKLEVVERVEGDVEVSKTGVDKLGEHPWECEPVGCHGHSLEPRQCF
jgi:hypothetical protein